MKRTLVATAAMAIWLLNGTTNAAEARRVSTPLRLHVQQNCPAAGTQGVETSALAAAIVGALAAPATKALTSSLGAAILKASGANDQTYSVTTVGRTYQYQLSDTGSRSPYGDFRCMILYARLPDDLSDSLPDPKNTDFYMELRVNASVDQLAFSVRPVFLRYPYRFSTGKDVLEMSLALEFLSYDAQPFASAVIPLKQKPSAKVVTASQLTGLDTGWLPLRAVTQSLEDARTLYTSTLTSKDSTAVRIREELLARLAKHEPITVKATLTETKDVSKFLQAVGNVLVEQSEAISTAVAPKLVPDSDDTKKAEQDTKLTAQQNYVLARIDFEEKLAAYQDVSKDSNASRTQKNDTRSAAIGAKYALLKAALAASITLPADDPAMVFTGN